MAAKSVHVEYVAAGSYMAIDAGSVLSLELLRPLQPGAAGAATRKASSLFGCASVVCDGTPFCKYSVEE